MLRARHLVPGLVLAFAGGVLALGVTSSWFQSAGAGAALALQPVALPALSGQIHMHRHCAFAPPLEQLLGGDTVITTQSQFREVWKQLFAGTPFDPNLVDFTQDFVVLMGSGLLQSGSFTIDGVEQVTAQWANVGGPGGPTDAAPFLAIAANTFIPGVQQQNPPPPAYHLAAVQISRAHLGSVVFHRGFIMGV